MAKPKTNVTSAARTGLENKVRDHNEKYGDKPSKRVTYRMLEASFKRGIGAYKTNPGSVRPNVKRQVQAQRIRPRPFTGRTPIEH